MKKFLYLLISLFFFVCVGGCIAVGFNAFAEKNLVLPDTELFVPSGITLEPLCYDRELLYDDGALKLVSHDGKERAKLKNELSGEFTMEYLPEKEDSVFTAERFTVTFTEAGTGNVFSVNLKHGNTTDAYKIGRAHV